MSTIKRDSAAIRGAGVTSLVVLATCLSEGQRENQPGAANLGSGNARAHRTRLLRRGQSGVRRRLTACYGKRRRKRMLGSSCLS
jgi:hypothetical protein